MRFIGDHIRGDSTAFVSALGLLKDAQASSRILCLSAASSFSFLFRTLSPEETRQAEEKFDKIMEWALTSILPGERAQEVALLLLDKVCDDAQAGRHQALLRREAIW